MSALGRKRDILHRPGVCGRAARQGEPAEGDQDPAEAGSAGVVNITSGLADNTARAPRSIVDKRRVANEATRSWDRTSNHLREETTQTKNAPQPVTSDAVVRGKGAARVRGDDLSTDLHRRLIGWVGLVFPVGIAAIVIFWESWDAWRRLDSISAYYYSSAAAAFCGMLVTLALFLLTYRGFDNPHIKWDTWLTNAAAVFALGVAFFPTVVPEGYHKLSWWKDWVGVVHYLCAGLLFASFAVISGWLFTLPHEKLKPNPTDAEKAAYKAKLVRDAVHIVWAAVIAFAIVAVVVFKLVLHWPIFWPESVALVAFAFSWLAKGQVRLLSPVAAARQGMKDLADVATWDPRAGALGDAGAAAVRTPEQQKDVANR
jgi:hypothetical protein